MQSVLVKKLSRKELLKIKREEKLKRKKEKELIINKKRAAVWSCWTKWCGKNNCF